MHVARGMPSDGVRVQGSSLPEDRMDRLERLLLQQDAALTGQESLIRQYKAEALQLQSLLRHLEKKLSLQQNVLHQQNAQLSHHESLFRQYQAEVLQLKSLRRHQDRKLSLQENILRQQNSSLSLGNVKLPHQERSLLRRRAKKVLCDHTKTQQIEGEWFFLQKNVDVSEVQNGSNSGTLDGKDTVTPESHSVSARSDDAGPLEAVTSHISQQVSEMTADIQAFKTQTNADIQSLKNSKTQQDNIIQDARSSTFVHWGSSKCSGSSQLVYSGVVGGSYFTHSGAATNFLCLTLSPVFSSHPIPSVVAWLYGGEYETFDSHHEKDPVCSVCRSEFSTTIMIPGTNVCTPGWHLQYSGFLMAGASSHTAGTEYVCVDSRLENNMHSDADENGKLLYYTVTQCGTLPCSPYVSGKIVTCAVCSK